MNGDGYCGACLSHRNIMVALAARAAAKAAAKVARMNMQRTTPMAVGTRMAAMMHSLIIFKTFISPAPCGKRDVATLLKRIGSETR